MHHYLKSYNDFAEEVDFAYQYSSIWKGLCAMRSLRSRLVFCYQLNSYMQTYYLKRLISFQQQKSILKMQENKPQRA